jgi:hypothetical protein
MMTDRRNRWTRVIAAQLLEFGRAADVRRNTHALVLGVVAGTIDWATAMITCAVAFNILAPCSLVY